MGELICRYRLLPISYYLLTPMYGFSTCMEFQSIILLSINHYLFPIPGFLHFLITVN